MNEENPLAALGQQDQQLAHAITALFSALAQTLNAAQRRQLTARLRRAQSRLPPAQALTRAIVGTAIRRNRARS